MLHRLLNRFGYTLVKTELHQLLSSLPDDPVFEKIYAQCKPYTMTSRERMYALYKAVQFIAQSGMPGHIVECGVWRGGSAMTAALTLLHYNDAQREIYLYDTFEGMSAPTDTDVSVRGEKAQTLLDQSEKNTEANVWCYADLDDVRRNMTSTNYPSDKIKLIKGKVEDTLPAQSPSGSIALLRLDTDWYESTQHELIHLYPLLSAGGVLIIDDYGHWAGCKKAVDEYFIDKSILLNRVDYTGVVGQKV